MKYICIILTFLISLSANELSSETSPYLKQHSTNPVNWYAWTDRAFQKAKKENKPIFISIGYSTCHWCHVMESESFESEKLAKLFNKYFICIKVDKEEMSQLDSYYQRLYKKVKGYPGGWPLNIFLTPEKKPFYMASYIPAITSDTYIGLDTLLVKLHFKYVNNLLNEYIQSIQKVSKQAYEKVKNEKISLKTLIASVDENYDDLSSGFGSTTKFPEASKVELMMDLAILSGSKDMKQYSFDMLNTMALRGLYDHVDGGFFRYSTDVDWEIPHFEKMLYTQAEMISLYSRAYITTKKELYKNVVIETIDMLKRRFLKDNLYFSASDAGSHDSEGRYFVFSDKEIKDALSKNKFSKNIKESLGSSINGNFISSNLSRKVHLNFHTKDRPKGFYEFRKKLAQVRSKRKYPFIDKKINTAWNALMIEALYKASLINTNYIADADKQMSALKDFMFDRGELYHQSLITNKPKQLGLLEDYSFFISALIAGYEVTFDEEKLDFALYLLSRAISKFYKNGVWYLSDDNLKIRADLEDTHYISPLSQMVQNIIKLASLKGSRKYERLAISTLKNLTPEIQAKQVNVPAAAIAYLMQKNGVITLKNAQKSLQRDRLKIENISYPYILLKEESIEKYLACSMKSCFAADEKIENIKNIIEKSMLN